MTFNKYIPIQFLSFGISFNNNYSNKFVSDFISNSSYLIVHVQFVNLNLTFDAGKFALY